MFESASFAQAQGLPVPRLYIVDGIPIPTEAEFQTSTTQPAYEQSSYAQVDQIAGYRSIVAETGRLKDRDFVFDHRSFPSTFATSIAMMSAVQFVRAASGGDFFSASFGLTLPLDAALTLTGHAIALNHIPALKKVFDGEVFGSRFEAPTRIGANILMGTAYTYASWGMAGVDFTSTKCLLALGLCGVVYPTLFFIKSRIFKKIPLNKDQERVEEFRNNENFGQAFQELEAKIMARAEELDIPEAERKYLTLTALENILLNHRHENIVRNTPSLIARKDVQKALKKINHAILRSSKQKAKINLINLLANIAEENDEDGVAASEDAKRILRFGNSLTSEQSIALTRAIAKRFHDHRRWVWAGSLADQFVSVGIAGGIGLYHVNDYALNRD